MDFARRAIDRPAPSATTCEVLDRLAATGELLRW